MATEQPPIVLITGAGTGIGKATVKLFANRGWQVIAGVRNPATYKDEYANIQARLLALDVTQPDNIAAALETIKKDYGRIDVLVNNAGYGLFGAFEQFTEAEIQQQYDVNVFGLMNMCRAVLPLLREQRSGCIVNVASMGGKFVVPYYGVYNSTKFAVEAFSEGLFYEMLPFNIRVKVVEPGAVRTDFYSRSKKVGTREVDTNTYKDIGTKLWRQYRAAGENGLASEAVAQVIYQAAISTSRRLRYVAGGSARLNVYMFKFLPHQLAMRLAQWMTLDQK